MLNRTCAVLVFLFLCAAPALAGNISGQSGLINIPDADTLRPQALEIGFHVMEDRAGISMAFGLIPRVEIGVKATGRDYDLGVTLKGALTQETKELPAIAVGVDGNSAYLVVSRAFSSLRGHIGIGNGRFHGPFAGASFVLNPVSVSRPGAVNPVTTLLVEHDGRHLNIGARVAFTPQFKADLALLDLKTAMLGLSYTARF
jgi:hypothetical protein